MSITPPAIPLPQRAFAARAGLLFAFALASCSPPDPDSAASPSAPRTEGERLRISVSIPPQAEFVRRIGGDRVAVDAFVDAGQDPHAFSATPSQVIALADSDAFFSIGMPFEAGLLPKIRSTLPNLKIFDMAEGIDVEKGAEDAHDHPSHARADDEKHEGDAAPDDHGHQGHGHGADPHIWLSPPLILDIAKNIHDALVDLDPSGASHYAGNLRSFQDEVNLLHTDLLFILEPCRGKSFYVYHPAFNHFARAYGLKERSIEIAGKSPSPRELMKLIDDAKRNGARVIFVQPQFDPASAKTVAESIGGRVVSIDPLAADVLANLRVVAQTIHDGLAKE